MFISPGEAIGPSACSSREPARPSQNNSSDQARFKTVGVLRPNSFMPWPIALGSPSPQAKAGLWHDAQDIQFDPDKRVSKNNVRPSTSRASVYSLPLGKGIESGRVYLARTS